MSDSHYLICDETREFVELNDEFATPYAGFLERAGESALRVDRIEPVGYQAAELEDDGEEALREVCSNLETALRIFFVAFGGKAPLNKEQKARAIQHLRSVHKTTGEYLMKTGGYMRFDPMDFFYPDD